MKRWLSLVLIVSLCISLTGAAQSGSSDVPEGPLGDYGDAPDGLSTEYVFNFEPHRDGQFPTLFRTDRESDDVDYVLHRFPEAQVYLGQTATSERNAQQVDRDLDDGWEPSSFLTCSSAALEVFVSVPESANEDEFYLNTLFDWDHNGQWTGSSTCSFDGGERRIDEWGIRNLALHEAPYNLEPGFQGTITLPAVTTGAMPGELWIRLTVTTERVNDTRFVPVQRGGAGWHGQGDFEYGETEDYLTCLFFEAGKPLDGCPSPLTTQQPIDPPPGEQVPVAQHDESSTPPSTPVDVVVRVNDTDPSGQPLTVTSTTPASNGTVGINASGDVTYTPDDGFTGDDQFNYTVCNPNGLCDTATVVVNVVQSNNPPVAEDDDATTSQDSDVTIDVIDNDVDPDGDSLTIIDNTNPTNGTVSCSEIACTYTPDEGFFGTDTFTYTISDGNGGTDTATVTITVPAPSADLSVSKDGPSQVNEGQDFGYSITVANAGPNDATNVAVVDTLPAAVEFVSAAGPGWSCGFSNGTVTCTRPSLAAGASTAISITVTAPETVGTLLNTVSTSADEDDPNDEDNTDEEETEVVNTTLGIAVVKSASPTSVPETSGDVTYTVEIVNVSDVDSVTIHEISDDQLTDLDLNAICGVPLTLSPEASETCSFTTTVSGQAGESHVNTITVSGEDDDGNTVNAQDDATVGFTDVAPTISVSKTASPTRVPETGGSATFTIAVTNDGDEPVTLQTLDDDQFGDLNGRGDCSVPQGLSAGARYECAFTATLTGDASGPDHVNVVTAEASDDEGNVASDEASATVAFTDVSPDLAVTKTASKSSVPESGGDVTFTVTVENNANEGVTLTSLSDTIFGDLNDNGNCALPQEIDGNGSYECAFTETLSGTVGQDHENTVTAEATDNEGNPWSGQDSATVAFTDEALDISVSKTANPTSVVETGGDVTFTIEVVNNAPESVTLDGLTDDVFGDLDGTGTCAVPQTLVANGGNYECQFTETIAGDANGSDHTNTVTADASDDDGNTDSESASATVAFANASPSITVSKTPDRVSVPESGGDVTFTVAVTNDGPEDVELTSLADDRFGNLNGAGGCALPQSLAANGGRYQCAFTETLSGNASGPNHTNTVTATAEDNEGTDAIASDDATVSFDDVQPSIAVSKTTNRAHVPETGGDVTFSIAVTNSGDEAVTLDALDDSAFGDLNGVGSCATGGSISPGTTVECSFSRTLTGDANGPDHVNTVTAEASDDEDNSATAQDDATVGFTDVAPSLSVSKSASVGSVPETGGSVTFDVSITNTSDEPVTLTGLSDSEFGNLHGAGDCATGGDIAAGDTYACSFTEAISGDTDGTDHVNTVTATVTDNDGTSAQASDSATVGFDDVLPSVSVTKSADPTSVDEPGGDVTFSITVTNTSAENVTLSSLSDDVFGDLNGTGDCATGGTISAGASYACSFTETISGNAGGSHTNTVTARVEDDDGNDDADSDDATVSITDPGPAGITVEKTANPTSVPETGGNVTYTVTVTNDSTVDEVEITSVSDNRFGSLDSDCGVPFTLGPGESADCSFTETISGDAGATHENVVTASGTDDDGANVSDQDSATVAFTDTQPDISVTKIADDTSPNPGAIVTYTVTITNNTDEAVDIASLSDDQVSGASASDCESTTVPANSSVTCTYTDTAPEDDNTELTNTVTVTVEDDDGNSATESDSETITTPDTTPSIGVTKSADDTSPEPGATVTYTVTIANNTDEAVDITSLSDDQVDGASLSACSSSTIPANGSITCTYTDTAPTDDNTALTNTVTVEVSDDDGNTTTGSDTETVTTTDIKPSIAVEKTNDANGDGSFSDSETAPSSGTTVDFRVVITNNTSESVSIVSISDDHHSVSVSHCSSSTVSGNGSVTCTFSGTVDADETNTVTVQVSDDDGNAVSDSDTSTVTIDDGTWSKASLVFTGQGKSCSAEEVFATIKNGDDSGAMQRTTTYELWYNESGNPKDGTKIASGTIPALDPGETYRIEESASEGNGAYIFKAIQPVGHPGQREIWSEEISYDCN